MGWEVGWYGWRLPAAPATRCLLCQPSLARCRAPNKQSGQQALNLGLPEGPSAACEASSEVLLHPPAVFLEGKSSILAVGAALLVPAQPANPMGHPCVRGPHPGRPRFKIHIKASCRASNPLPWSASNSSPSQIPGLDMCRTPGTWLTGLSKTRRDCSGRTWLL